MFANHRSRSTEKQIDGAGAEASFRVTSPPQAAISCDFPVRLFSGTYQALRCAAALLVSASLLLGCGVKSEKPKQYEYVSAPQAMLRDNVAAVYNKVGIVKNGEQVEVLEK